MSSHVDRIHINTRSRLKSDDFNRGSRLQARALIESISAYALGDVFKAAGTGVGGVVGGYMVRAVTGTNEVEVSPGVALVATTPASETYDPPALWVELGAATRVDLTALIDGANPRLVTIELEPAEATKVSQSVDRFDVGTGTFVTVVDQPLVVGSEPLLVSSTGAAAASPVVAAGTVGRIPLAVVKLTAGQANFQDDFAPVLMCRPLLSALGERVVPRDYVRGGGLSVGEESGGSVGSLTSLAVHSASMSLAGLEADPSGALSYGSHGRTIDGTTTGSLTGSVRPVYAYAAPPPWAADYGSIAPREAWQRNPNEVATSEPYSVIGGAGSTFTSLLAETTAGPGRARRNAIVFFDSAAPWGVDVGSGNAPVRVIDARGPHPETAPGGSGSIELDDTQDPTWGSEQVVTETVYLGALSSIGTSNFVAQSYRGAGAIEIIDALDIGGGTGRRPLFKDTSSANSGGNVKIYPGNHAGMGLNDDPILPRCPSRLNLGVMFDTGSGGSAVLLAVGAVWGHGSPDPTSPGRYRSSLNDNSVVNLDVDDFVTTAPATDGSIEYHLIASGGVPANIVVAIYLAGYTDAILASR